MEAKDTVMTTDYPINDTIAQTIHKTLTRQAELSFKAGIKEVVDWLRTHNGEPKKEPMWNAKLKEWGIN